MNILQPIDIDRPWPVVCCAWCGDDMNANANVGMWDMRNHFAECQLFLSSEAGQRWLATDEGQAWAVKAAKR